MTLQLLLIRHARASKGEVDHRRPLDEKGRAEAPRMGAWIAEKGLVPGLALCSDAHRTRETLDLMLPLWPQAPEVRHLRALYHASADALLAALAGQTEGSLALVGHNPGIGDLAARLAARAPDHPGWGDFPPCFVAALRVEAGAWADLGDGAAAVTAFGVP